MGSDASLLAQQIDGHLVSMESLRTDNRVRLESIPSTDEALRDLGTFSFVELHLISAGRFCAAVITYIIRLIEILEDLHSKVQGVITSPNFLRKILYDLCRLFSMY